MKNLYLHNVIHRMLVGYVVDTFSMASREAATVSAFFLFWGKLLLGGFADLLIIHGTIRLARASNWQRRWRK